MHPYEVNWYSTVLSAVGMDTDLSSMVQGDATVVSDLSGGQKQRYIDCTCLGND